MPAIPSQLTSLDFFEIKESIRSYLRTRNEFSDYDFEGSAASYLLDILAYNTYYTAFNANMALNEAFLETATVRDNIVRIAKQLNYTPRSIKAAKACVTVTATVPISLNGTNYPEYATLQKGDVFVASTFADTFTFAVTRDVQVPVDPTTGKATFENLIMYQGNLLTYDYTVDYTKKQDYIIPDENVDTDLIYVDISPNQQSEEIDTYTLAKNVTALDGTSRIYYLEETDDLRYRIIFGDGVIGRKLIDGEYIRISYVSTIGQNANGASDFAFVGRVIDSDGRNIPPSRIKVETTEKAQQGEDREDALSIKYRAPRAFATQNRAVTESDYEHIVKEIYPQAAAVTAYGGEKLSPPIYGKVFIAVRPKTGNKLNATTKKSIEQDLAPYVVASVQPEIIDPTIYYIIPKTYAYYDGNATPKSGAQLSSDVLKSVDQYNKANQNNRFNGRFDTSKYGAMVDNTDPAIAGSVTQTTLGQNVDEFAFNQVFTQCLDFGNPLHDPSGYSGNTPGNGGDSGTCTEDRNCPPGQVCVNGVCKTPCGDSSSCPEGYECVNGYCEPTGGTDDTDPGDGGNGSKCKPSFSVVKSGTFYADGYTDQLVDLALATGGQTGATNATTGVQSPLLAANATEIQATVANVPVKMRDDGLGNLMLVTERDETEVILNENVGSVDYANGVVCVGPLNIVGTPDDTTRVPVQVLPYPGSIIIPPGVDPTIFNPAVNTIDINRDQISIPTFDPNNFQGYNYGNTTGINIIDYPDDSFEYPVPTSCF